MEMMNYWEGKSSNCSMPFSNKREYGLCILTTYPMQDLVGWSRPFPEDVIKNNKYRETIFSTSHLRAYYTQLFRNIKE
jgi:hypothetical protein